MKKKNFGIHLKTLWLVRVQPLQIPLPFPLLLFSYFYFPFLRPARRPGECSNFQLNFGLDSHGTLIGSTPTNLGTPTNTGSLSTRHYNHVCVWLLTKFIVRSCMLLEIKLNKFVADGGRRENAKVCKQQSEICRWSVVDHGMFSGQVSVTSQLWRSILDNTAM